MMPVMIGTTVLRPGYRAGFGQHKNTISDSSSSTGDMLNIMRPGVMTFTIAAGEKATTPVATKVQTQRIARLFRIPSRYHNVVGLVVAGDAVAGDTITITPSKP